MKSFYHVCLTAHSEVLLRSVEDVALFTNLSAVAALRTGAELLADSDMSTHLHETVLSDKVKRFVWSQQLSLTKAFNYRHSRRGPLFDASPYILEIKGTKHMQMALTYTLRQGSHHGQSETPFDYKWSTCNSLFAADRGIDVSRSPLHCSRSDVRMFLPRNFNEFPDNWQVDSNGILHRDSFEQLRVVENWYGTARNFMFSMLRRTSKEWLAEQDADGVNGPAVTLDLLEKGYSADDIATMLSLEGNTKFSYRGMSDMDLCDLIDTNMLHRFRVSSVYQLSDKQKSFIADELRHDVGIRSENQIARCLAMKYLR